MKAIKAISLAVSIIVAFVSLGLIVMIGQNNYGETTHQEQMLIVFTVLCSITFYIIYYQSKKRSHIKVLLPVFFYVFLSWVMVYNGVMEPHVLISHLSLAILLIAILVVSYIRSVNK